MKRGRLIVGTAAGLWLLGSSMTLGVTSNWTASGGDFNDSTNWDNGVPTDTDVGVLKSITPSPPITISLSGDAAVGGLTFWPAASSHEITIGSGHRLDFMGSGITHSALDSHTFETSGSGAIAFHNVAHAAQNITVINNPFGMTQFNDWTMASSATIQNEGGRLDFLDGSNADHAKIINHFVPIGGGPMGHTGQTNFRGRSRAGHSTISNVDGRTYFYDLSSADYSTIQNHGTMAFDDRSTAGHATLDNGEGFLIFFGSSTAAEATVNNGQNGQIRFNNDSTAGQATIINTDTRSEVGFYHNASAGNAQMEVRQGLVSFNDDSTAGSALIALSTGMVTFNENSTADNAQINISSRLGTLQFMDQATAGDASIASVSGSTVVFRGLSNAGSAVIHNGGTINFLNSTYAGRAAVFNASTASVNFFNVANAGNASIINLATSSIVFHDGSNAGDAVLINTNGGRIQFDGASSGGSASITNNGGVFDVSSLVIPAISVGSLSGTGSFLFGAAEVTTGVNGVDTLIDGPISGIGGSLVKVGTGTLTLYGDNTYSGETTIHGGTLRIRDANNLGGGDLNFSSGTLQITADIPSYFHDMNLAADGGTVDTHGFDFRSAGEISGPGSLTKTGEGTLTVYGLDTYTGGTRIQQGILTVEGSNVLPHTGTVTLSDTPGVQLDMTNYSQTIGSLSGGGNAGGHVVLGNATLTLADNTSNRYAGSISGSGAVIKNGTGTWALTGNHIFTGSTTVNQGQLELTGTLRGNVVVKPSARFSGTGNLDKLINAGTVAPGDSNGPGTLSVHDYAGPGVLDMTFGPSSFSRLVVTASATLTGSSLVISGNATDFVTGRYSVITASQVVDSLASIQTPLSSYFLTVDTEYTPKSVDVLVLARNFSDAAENENQHRVASALDASRSKATGEFSNVIQAIYGLGSAEQAHQAFAQLSGDSLASFQSAWFKSADVFTSQMNARATPAGFARASQSIAPVQLAYAKDLVGSALGLDSTSGAPNAVSPLEYGLWARGLGFFDHIDGDASKGSPASRTTTGGFQAGYDFYPMENVLFGFSGGFAQSSLTVDDRSSAGNSTSIQSGIYASYAPGPWFGNGSMAYTTSANKMARSIQFAGINETARADFQSRSYTLFIEGGYRYQPREHIAVEPSLSLRQSRLHQDAFRETGAPGLNLDIQEESLNSLVSALGGRITRRFFPANGRPLLLGFRAAWQHELKDINNSMAAQFAGAGIASAFTVQGTPRDRDAASLGLDGRIDLSRALQAFADYSATLSSSQQTHGIFGGISVKW